MKFSKTSLQDAVLIDLDKRQDERGFFARTFCAEEFARAGLVTSFPQANHSCNVRAGTLRGMHFQKAPHGEVKLVRCVAGAIWDAIIDLRPELAHLSALGRLRALRGERPHALRPRRLRPRLPDPDRRGGSHLLVSHPYTPGAEGGVRYDDPAFAIAWPRAVSTISDKDAAWPHVDLRQGVPL